MKEKNLKEKFKKLTSTFQESIFTWDYFTDFQKIDENIKPVKKELHLLDSLLGSGSIESDFIELVKEYPKVRNSLPILIALRRKKVTEESVVTNVQIFEAEPKGYIFYGPYNEQVEKELLLFFENSGLKSFFTNKRVKSIFDYIYGVEVGMDTNARKNRTGTLMENIVEKYISDFCTINDNFSYERQANRDKIKKNFGFDLKLDKSKRNFDFAVYNSDSEQPSLFEVNYYGGGGSKLKATAGEYEKLYSFLTKQDVKFFWITDGFGWQSTLKPLEEAFNKNDGHIYNIEMLKNGILDQLLGITSSE